MGRATPELKLGGRGLLKCSLSLCSEDSLPPWQEVGGGRSDKEGAVWEGLTSPAIPSKGLGYGDHLLRRQQGDTALSKREGNRCLRAFVRSLSR